MAPPDKKILSWCLFDFANSSYSAVISAVIFPVFYAKVVAVPDGDMWWGRAVSVSMAIVALTSPFVGGIADFAGYRKRLLLVYTLTCVSAVSMFSLLGPGMAVEGFVLIVIANIGMEGGFVFYNSFLTLIAPKSVQGRVSSWGYAVGYAGSILSLLIALPLVSRGIYPAAWLMVAGFFLLFSMPAFFNLPPDSLNGKIAHSASRGLKFTMNTLRDIWRNRQSRKFLMSYLLYEDGVNTVIVFSSLYAAVTLNFQTEELIGLYILVQAMALAGAAIMARPVDYWGPKKVVSVSLILWTCVSVLAYLTVSKAGFWLVAVIAGLGLGTVQAASRAFYAQLIPEGHENEYFGVYSMVGKSSAVLGPLLFGEISSRAGSQRPAILFIALFFLAGLVMIQFVKGGGPNAIRK